MPKAEPKPQTFENHARIVFGYHRLGLGIVIVNLGWSIYKVIRAFSFDTVDGLLVAILLFLIFFYARTFALTAQDRVIRLEMTVRLKELLPEDLRSRIKEFKAGQLIALRFASDEELPELARKVLADNLTDRKAIKKMIKNWKPDYLRV